MMIFIALDCCLFNYFIIFMTTDSSSSNVFEYAELISLVVETENLYYLLNTGRFATLQGHLCFRDFCTLNFTKLNRGFVQRPNWTYTTSH